MRLQLIDNIDTLSKSHKDAEEEQLERRQELEMQGRRIPRSSQHGVHNDEDENDNTVISHYEQDCSIELN